MLTVILTSESVVIHKILYIGLQPPDALPSDAITLKFESIIAFLRYLICLKGVRGLDLRSNYRQDFNLYVKHNILHRFKVGDLVVYIPRHLINEKHIPEDRIGVIHSIKDKNIYVKYKNSSTPQLTPISLLYLIFP